MKTWSWTKKNKDGKRPCCRCKVKPRFNGRTYCKDCERAYRRAYMKKWRKNNPLTLEQKRKDNARSYLNVYIRRGKIKRPNNCELCGKKGFVEAHHEDYSKPLTVKWLCKKCHLDYHKDNGISSVSDDFNYNRDDELKTWSWGKVFIDGKRACPKCKKRPKMPRENDAYCRECLNERRRSYMREYMREYRRKKKNPPQAEAHGGEEF